MLENNADRLGAYWNHSEQPNARLYRELRDLQLPPHPRETVSTVPGDPSIRGACAGVTWGCTKVTYCAGIRHIHTALELIRECAAIADPDFRYTSIQINQNLRAKMHADTANAGPSMIISLGPFVGGWT